MSVEFNATNQWPGSDETLRARQQEVSPGAFATLQDELFTAAQWAAWHRDVVQMKDKTYRRFPIGEDVGRFLRRLRVDGASVNTLESYESVLRRLALDHCDFETLARFCEPDGYDLLYDFLDRHWGDSTGDTIRQRSAILRSFFGWGVESGRLPFNPAEKVKVERRAQRLREAHELSEIRMIASAQPRIGDQAAVLVMGRLALRKMETANLQARDVDLTQDVLRIRAAKGDKPAELPITFPDVRQLLLLWLLEPDRRRTDHLIAPERGRARALTAPSVHRWWERCCKRAGIDGFTLHELRHSALHRIWRDTGDLYAAKQLARHASVKTTEDYLHPTNDDLRARMLESDGKSA